MEVANGSILCEVAFWVCFLFQGAKEREMCYKPIIDEIVSRFPPDKWWVSAKHSMLIDNILHCHAKYIPKSMPNTHKLWLIHMWIVRSYVDWETHAFNLGIRQCLKQPCLQHVNHTLSTSLCNWNKKFCQIPPVNCTLEQWWESRTDLNLAW